MGIICSNVDHGTDGLGDNGELHNIGIGFGLAFRLEYETIVGSCRRVGARRNG